MHVLKCPDCGQEVSGPDKNAVTETMGRHYAKSGHGAKPKATKPKEKANAD